MSLQKFKATMYVTAYELARDGLPNKQIAKTLGVQPITFKTWVARKPALDDALKRGRHSRDPQNEFTFHEYVYDHLSPHLRELWDEINECEKLDNGVERVEALLKNSGIRARQHMFLYALTQSMFNISQSLRKLNIPRKHYEMWRASDPAFLEMMDEIHWHKKNFFEHSFIRRVAVGDTAAVIHAVKTQCRDRGYNDKIEIEHSGTIKNEHTISIIDLPLDLDTRRKVLDALRVKMKQETAIETTATTPGGQPCLPA